MPELLAQAIVVLSLAVLALLLPFAAHRTYLLLLSRRPPPELPRRWSGPWPRVTVQLPLYNEAPVARRVIDAACSLDYPARALEIQVLDDSIDETVELVARRVAWWRARGVNVCHIRRRKRAGFKAGALAAGVRRAHGEFLLVLDSDFVPEPDLVKKLLPPFRLPRVGMVQARWDHLNEDANWLTRAQSLLLDGHFFFEHGGRYRGGLFFNFNGTAGMWRRECLEDAGGWQADTLTEDLDISYRAQMHGWRFVFREDIGVPAELPRPDRRLRDPAASVVARGDPDCAQAPPGTAARALAPRGEKGSGGPPVRPRRLPPHAASRAPDLSLGARPALAERRRVPLHRPRRLLPRDHPLRHLLHRGRPQAEPPLAPPGAGGGGDPGDGRRADGAGDAGGAARTCRTPGRLRPNAQEGRRRRGA